MPKVGFFTADALYQAQTREEFASAMHADSWTDMAFCHAHAGNVAEVPAGLSYGRNVFGPGHSPVMIHSATAMHPVRRVASVMLNNARFSSFSLTALDANMRVFADGIENVVPPDRLADFDGNFERGEDGTLHVAAHFLRGEIYEDCIAMPICSHGFPNYGHFMFDGLPAVLLHRQMFPTADLRIIGQPLADFQVEILRSLGLLDLYLQVDGPVVFRKLLTSTLLSMHVPYPTRFVRPVFDYMRFAMEAPAGPRTRRLFLSRGGVPSERPLRNLDEIEALMERLGFQVVRPEGLTVQQQVVLMSQALFVVGETGAAMTNIGFCDPGTKILEIQPDRFVDGWVRATCFLFAHRWHVYFARLEDDTDGIKHRFSYRIDVADLERAVRTIDAAE